MMNSNDLLKNLMKLQSKCPNCNTTLTFEDAARLGKDNGVSENAIMCHNCRRVYMVEIAPDKMTMLHELTKYNFANTKKTVSESKATPTANTVKTDSKPKTTTNTQKTTSKPKITPAAETHSFSQPVNNYQINDSLLNRLKDNEVTKFLFTKTDAEFGIIRPSKAKIISALWFIIMIVLAIINDYNAVYYHDIFSIISDIVGAFILTIPVYVIGWVIGWFLDRDVKKTKQLAELYNMTNKNNKSFCRHCGSEVIKGTKFCSNCGKQL